MVTIEELEKFFEFKTKGGLTEEEFNSYKEQFLSQVANKTVKQEGLENIFELKNKGIITEGDFNFFRHKFLAQELNKTISTEQVENFLELKNKGIISEGDFNALRNKFLGQDTGKVLKEIANKEGQEAGIFVALFMLGFTIFMIILKLILPTD